MHQIIQNLNDWYSHALQSGGYPLVALMMAVESSLFPLPSEIVIPPAAHLAYTGQIPLSLWGIVLAGMIGSWFGATLMYWACLLYTSDAADDLLCVDLGGRRIIK